MAKKKTTTASKKPPTTTIKVPPKPRPIQISVASSMPTSAGVTSTNTPITNSNTPLSVSTQGGASSRVLTSAEATNGNAPTTNSNSSKEDPDPVPLVSTQANNLHTSSGSLQGPKPKRAKSANSTSDDSAVLAARLATALAEIDRLKKQESAMKTNEPKEIKRLNGKITDLQKAMGLEDQKALYISCCATVRDVVMSAGIPFDKDWRRQEPLVLAKVLGLAGSRNPQLRHYEHSWATLEIMRTINKNKRNYWKKIGRMTSDKTANGNEMEGREEEEEEEGFSDSDKEGSSLGKRKR